MISWITYLAFSNLAKRRSFYFISWCIHHTYVWVHWTTYVGIYSYENQTSLKNHESKMKVLHNLRSRILNKKILDKEYHCKRLKKILTNKSSCFLKISQSVTAVIQTWGQTLSQNWVPLPAVTGDMEDSYLTEKSPSCFFVPVGIQGGFAINFFWYSMLFKRLFISSVI